MPPDVSDAVHVAAPSMSLPKQGRGLGMVSCVESVAVSSAPGDAGVQSWPNTYETGGQVFSSTFYPPDAWRIHVGSSRFYRRLAARNIGKRSPRIGRTSFLAKFLHRIGGRQLLLGES
jgi:hypothetical protein